jgi:hypothetical protein
MIDLCSLIEISRVEVLKNCRLNSLLRCKDVYWVVKVGQVKYNLLIPTYLCVSYRILACAQYLVLVFAGTYFIAYSCWFVAQETNTASLFFLFASFTEYNQCLMKLRYDCYAH